MTKEKLLTVKEATAAGYGSEATLYRRRVEHKLPAVMKLGKLYFKESDLKALAEEYRPPCYEDFEKEARIVMANMGKLNSKTRQELAELAATYMPM